MPAYGQTKHDLLHNGIGFFHRGDRRIQTLRMRPGPAVANNLSVPQTLRVLIDLISDDPLVAAYWEAL